MRLSTPQNSAFPYEEQDPAPPAVLQLGRCAVLACVVIAPWFFGCIRDTESLFLFTGVVAAATLAGLACWFRAFLVPHAPARIPLLLLPLLAAVCLGAVQLLPAEQTLVDGPIERVPEFAGVDTGVEVRSQQLSFYPDATRHEIVRGVLACLALMTGYLLFRSTRSRQVLWAALAVNGLALAGFGMAQQLSWNGRLFWRVPLTQGGVPFASFVNKNNAAAYLLITAAATVGLLLLTRTSDGSGRVSWDRMVKFFARLNTRSVGILIALVVIGTGMVASRSRGGFLAMLAATTVVLFIEGRRRRSWAPVLVGALAVGGVSLLAVSFQFSEVLQQRFARVAENEVTDDGRIKHWSDVVHVLSATPWTGTGLGSYRYATQPFITQTNQPWFVHADNQFVETAVEAGLAGLILVSLLIGFGLWSGWRMVAAGAFASGAVLIFLVTGQAAHAVFDFGIILPATLVAAAVVAGSSLAALTEGRGSGLRAGRFAMPVLVTAMAVLGWGCLPQCVTFADQEYVLRETERPGSLLATEEAMLRVDSALKNSPGHAELHRRMAELHIARYEFTAARQIRERSPDLSDDQVAALSSVVTLSQRLRDLRRDKRDDLVKSVLSLEPVRRNVPAARSHLAAALKSCPVLTDCDTMLFELAGLSEPQAPQLRYFSRALRLEPSNEMTLARLGPLAYRLPGAREVAERCIRRALTSTDQPLLKQVLAATRPRNYADFARCLPHSTPDRFRVASVLPSTPVSEFAGPLLQDLLKHSDVWAASIDPEEVPQILDSLSRHDLNEQCLSLCRRLAEQHSGNGLIRYQLARCLLKVDRKHEALAEARVAAAIEPHNPRITQFLNQLERSSRKRTNPETGS